MIAHPIPVTLSVLLLSAPGTASAAATPAKTAAAKVRPLTVESLLTQSRAAAARGETELALRLAQSAIVADPARASSYVALGDIYAGAGQPGYARSYYDAALDINPVEPGALKAIAALGGAQPSTTAQAEPQAAP